MSMITLSAFEEQVWVQERVRILIVRSTPNYTAPDSILSYSANYPKAIADDKLAVILGNRIARLSPKTAFRIIKGDSQQLVGGRMLMHKLRATYKD